MKARVYQNLCNLTFDVLLMDERGSQKMIYLPVAQEVKYLEQGERSLLEPTYQWQFEQAEAIFQALWDTGLRPAKGQGGAAEVEALKNHVAFAERVAEKALDRVVASPMVVSPTL